jgi:hypothetical protein
MYGFEISSLPTWTWSILKFGYDNCSSTLIIDKRLNKKYMCVKGKGIYGILNIKCQSTNASL